METPYGASAAYYSRLILNMLDPNPPNERERYIYIYQRRWVSGLFSKEFLKREDSAYSVESDIEWGPRGGGAGELVKVYSVRSVRARGIRSGAVNGSAFVGLDPGGCAEYVEDLAVLYREPSCEF
jgi:hypothetical protein